MLIVLVTSEHADNFARLRLYLNNLLVAFLRPIAAMLVPRVAAVHRIGFEHQWPQWLRIDINLYYLMS